MHRRTRRLLLPVLSTALFTAGVVIAPPASAAPPTGFGIVASSGTSVFGQAVTFTVTLTGPSGRPTGSVDVLADGLPLCASVPLGGGGSIAVATCTTSNLTLGDHDITATYTGDSNYDGDVSTSHQPALAHEVTQASTTTALDDTPDPSVLSGPVTLTATIAVAAPGAGSPTGTVAFAAGGSPITGCAARPVSSGSAGCTTSALPVGSDSLTATYSGDANFTGSTSTAASHTVTRADTTTTVTGAPNPSTWAADVTYTASVDSVAPATAPPTGGTVDFRADNVPIEGCQDAAMTGGTATCTTDVTPTGAPEITAAFGGNDSFTASVSPAHVQVVGRAATDTELSTDENPSRSGQPVTFTATITSPAGTPTGSVSFYAVQRDASRRLLATKTLAGGAASTTTASLPVRNDTPIEAEYHGTTTFAASEDAIEQTVHRSFSRTLLSSSANPSKYGQVVTLSVEVRPMVPGGGLPAGKVAFYRTSDGVRRWIGTARLAAGRTSLRTSRSPVGLNTIEVRYSGGANHRPSERVGVQRVKP